MSCCWSKAAVDVIGHPKSYSSAATQADFPERQLSPRERNLYSAKSRITTPVKIIRKPPDSSSGVLITADASGELSKDRAEYGAEPSASGCCPRDGVCIKLLVGRHPSTDVATRGKTSYFPVIVNLENGELFAFKNLKPIGRHSEWLSLPGIGFLPKEVADIIAGGEGLLCVNGGVQPRKKNRHTPPIPHAEDYNHRLYPTQSILLVCNPVTEEIRFLPRHSIRKLDNKIACLQVVSSDDPGNKSSKSKFRYRVHIVGGHHERASLRDPASDELVFMTYDSRSDTWISTVAVGRARIPALAKTGIASQEGGFYLGGQEESEEVTMVVKGDTNLMPLQGRFKRMSSRGLFRRRCVWINKIFFIQAMTLKWHSVDFEILGDDGLPYPELLQAPRVVQCRPGGPVYAVTRTKKAAKTIEIYEVVIVNGFPTGEFIRVTKMPEDIFTNLFESETSMRAYDCAAGEDYLCFLVGPPNQSTLGVWDFRRQKWFMSILPGNSKGTGRYALGKTQWTPSSTARA